MDPKTLNKYLYIERTPTWLVRSFYLIGIATWMAVIYGFSGALVYDPIFRWIVGPILFLFTIYHLCSYGLALFYRRPSLKQHKRLVESFWQDRSEAPSVDVFLPICGEEISVLHHTWENVARLSYPNTKVYVLDDSKEDTKEHEQMAKRYGFTYLERPNKGELKKAGNLKYGYERSTGDFILILDADFAPHPDMLVELLPYMSNPKVGIVQSPQYFDTSKAVHDRSPLAYGGAHVQEAFYRFIEVARDRFGGTICCGSNAVYRRAALDQIGGTVQIEHSEDAHTGFALTKKGWVVRYTPVILAVGECPDNAHMYFHQQHRWCSGSLSLLSTKEFWTAPVSWKTKFCYLVGLLFYAHHPFSIIFSFQLFYTLFFYNDYISVGNGVLFYPYVIWSFAYMFWFPISKYRWGCFYANFMQLYAYSHACITNIFKGTVGWIPTNTKHMGLSSAYRHTTLAVSIYVFVYLTLLALAIRMDMLHLFNYHFWSLEFWIFWNVLFSGMLLWHMYRTAETTISRQIANGMLKQNLRAWQLKTAVLYIFLITIVFLGILYL